MINKLFDKPEVSQTTTGGTTSGAMPHMENAQGMWQDYIDQGPTAYSGPIVGAHDPSAAMNQYTGSLGAMQNQYGGKGGIYDQATKRYGELAGFDPGKMQAGNFLQGPDMAQYMDRMGYDPKAQMAQAKERARELGSIAGINENARAMRGNAGGQFATRTGVEGAVKEAQIGSGLAMEMQDREAEARRAAVHAMQGDINRQTGADQFNIANKYKTAGLQGDMLSRYQDISPRMQLASRFGDQGRYQDQLQMAGDQQRYQDFQRQQNFMPQALSGYTNFLGNPGWGSSSTSTQTGEGQSMFDQGLGLAMTGAGIYGMGGGFKGMFGA